MTIGVEEKLDLISWVEKHERIADTLLRLDSLMVQYVQFVIMLTELKKVLHEEIQWVIKNFSWKEFNCGA